ncbi:MAG: hypothetical protein H6814_10875 [Phycisphaeraceae bacterium]|nr:hypothetical protein [Phycisphaeraceae bacterium]
MRPAFWIGVTAAAACALTGCSNSSSNAGFSGRAKPVASTDIWGFQNGLSRQAAFWFAGQPDLVGLREARDHGVRTIINLRPVEHTEQYVHFDEPQAAFELGMEYFNIPVEPSTITPEAVEALATALQSTGRPVLIHGASMDEVGGIWAAYLVRYQNVPIDEAMASARAAGLTNDATFDAAIRAMVAPDSASLSEFANVETESAGSNFDN